MKDSARLFLDRKISRRTFAARLARLGIGSVAAGRLVQSLSPATVAGAASPSGRIVHDLTGGEVMAELLLDWDVRYVFGLGGSEEVGFLDALVDRVALHYVQGLHESAVMAMADGYARASGETAFVNVHSVAGTANALAQIVNAFKDRVPIVVTAGEQDTRIRGQNAFLEGYNLYQMPRDYAKWTWDVLGADTIPEVVRRAFLLARVPPAGPAFLTFSKNLWEERLSAAEILPRSRSALDTTLPPDDEAVSRLVDMLLDARLPVIVSGRELGRDGGTGAGSLREIAELVGAPVFSDLFASHGPITFPTHHPQYAGYFAEDATFPKDFDLFWSVGGTMFSAGAWTPQPLVPRAARAIHTGLDAAELGRTYPVDLAVLASAEATCAAVLEELRTRQLSQSVVDDRKRLVERYTTERRARLDAQAKQMWSSRPIANERLTLELDRRLDPDAILVTELITEEQLANAYMRYNQTATGRRQLTTSGGCLGWGVAAAVGAKIAQPDRQVAALVGDGSFQFGVQALWTAVRYEVPIAIVIWNNNAYQANRKYLHAYGGRAAATGKYIGCSLGSPDIDHVAICKGYGVEAERVEDPDELGAAIDRALAAVASGRPYALDVKVLPRAGGEDSTWYDFFSVAKKTPRRT